MKTELSLAYSPCPNDTFLFYHIVHQSLSKLFNIHEHLADVEKLNLAAQKGIYDVTKLSFFALFNVLDTYGLLNCGSALGRGCGPILIQKKGKKVINLHSQKILVPGLHTTANLLLQLHFNQKIEVVAVRYDKIIPSLLNGDYQYGVIIHEERFTFAEQGLEAIVDLGQWWEDSTGQPIPLGAIAMKRSLAGAITKEFEQKLQESLSLANQQPQKSRQYIKQNSQSLADEVIDKHIQLYVNDFTMDLGTIGRTAIQTLYEKAKHQKILSNTLQQPLFLHS